MYEAIVGFTDEKGTQRVLCTGYDDLVKEFGTDTPDYEEAKKSQYKSLIRQHCTWGPMYLDINSLLIMFDVEFISTNPYKLRGKVEYRDTTLVVSNLSGKLVLIPVADYDESKDVAAEPAIEEKVEPVVEPVVEEKPEPEPVIEPEPAVENGPEPVVEEESEPVVEEKVKPKPEAKFKFGSKPSNVSFGFSFKKPIVIEEKKPEPEPQPEPEPEPEPVESEQAPEPEVEEGLDMIVDVLEEKPELEEDIPVEETPEEVPEEAEEVDEEFDDEKKRDEIRTTKLRSRDSFLEERKNFLESLDESENAIIKQLPDNVYAPIMEFTEKRIDAAQLAKEGERYCVMNHWHRNGDYYYIDAYKELKRYYFNVRTGNSYSLSSSTVSSLNKLKV